jgi:DNA primase
MREWFQGNARCGVELMRATGFSSGGDIKGRVLAAVDIVELIGRSVALKKGGKEYVGLCPFHQEKTPSFHVNPVKQVFFCHGCEKSGNAIDFVMQRDRLEFKDALRMLAESAGIEMPAYGDGRENAGERAALLSALSAASLFFENLLSHPQQGRAARQYLAERGFTAESVQRFRIGLAADSWDALAKSAAMKKFTPQQLALAGLVKPRERNDGYYDTFRNRLIFPIRDENGRVIAFGGRVMPGSEDPAKYLNSPETPLYSKSRCLFGLDLARPRIVETRTVAVVEGYTDVVMAHQHGVSNVVSALGTALTGHQVRILRRFADRIVLLFDADGAGDNAVNRAVELFLTQPVEIAIASLPQGLDPDEYLLKHGAEAFEKLLSSASDALTYKWKQLVRKMNASDAVTSQQQAVEQYLQTLASARGSGPVDPLRWGAALTRVSRLTEITVPELNRRFKIGGAPKRGVGAPAAHADESVEPKKGFYGSPPLARQRAEGYIVGLLLLEPGRWHHVQQQVGPADFTDPELRRIVDLFWSHQRNEGEPLLNEFLGMLEESALKSVAMRWVEEASAAAEPDMVLTGSLSHVFDERRRGEERKLIARLRRTGQELPQDSSADLDDLRQLQEKARQPDMRRVGL